MEKTIKEVLRSIDVSTRFSSEQILVILLNAQDKDVEVIAGRIFSGFHKIYHKNAVNLSYDIADLHGGKDILNWKNRTKSRKILQIKDLEWFVSFFFVSKEKVCYTYVL